MILTIVMIVVLALLAIAVLPSRKRDLLSEPAIKQSTGLFQTQSQPLTVSLREQQLREESDAIATEFRKRADEVWLAEIREKAASLLGPTK
jgi:hypothetical protein